MLNRDITDADAHYLEYFSEHLKSGLCRFVIFGRRDTHGRSTGNIWLIELSNSSTHGKGLLL